jgi:hypothetical protein
LTIPTNEPLLKARQWRKLVTVENKFESRREETDMTEFLRKTRVSGVVENVAEYVVMLFVAAMTGLSTLRLLGILP